MPDSPLPTHRNPRREAFGTGVPPARYKLLSPARLPITRAPVVASQHSPNALLESPVLLTQVKAEPSPTTGTFFMPISSQSNPSSCAESSPTTRNLLEMSILKCSSGSCSDSAKRDVATLNPDEQQHKKPTQRENLSPHDLTLSISPSSMSNMQLQAENRKTEDMTAVESSSDDGYIWTKYGQKFVKGSELPRSYYECAHPGCQVKKQLECSPDGKITDVIYKGSHDHPMPQPGHQSAIDTVLPNQEEERIDPPFMNTEDIPHQVSCVNDCGVSSGQSAVPARNDDIEILAATSSINGNNVQSEDDPGVKRRREDAAGPDDSPVGKAIREPRVVVQTLSEIDVLDDGYRWRKYGQKVVKGNPNPRSYYKCTNVGCGVRKHVERASHDPKAVITTYEGKHNHDVPTMRSASHDMGASMASSNGNDQFSQVSAFLGAPRMYDVTRALPLQFHQPGASEIISLDLEVGLSPRYNSRDNNMLQAPLRRQIPHFSIHMGGSNRNIPVLQATTVPPFYEGLSTRLDSYMPRDTRGSPSFDVASTNHSCSSYKTSIGSLLAGP